MKLIVLLLITCMMSTSALCQKLDFTNRSNVWYYHGYAPHPYNKDYYYTYRYADTTIIINNRSYSLLDDVLVRMDTPGNKVYFRMLNDTANEQVLFDYNLQQGDTFKITVKPNPYPGIQPKTYTYVATIVDSVPINNIWHKRFQLNSNEPETSGGMGWFIEGLGSYLVFPFLIAKAKAGQFEYDYHRTKLYCFKSDNMIPIIGSPTVGPYINGSMCNDTSLRIENRLREESAILVYPQPAHERVQFKFPRNISEGELTLMNMTGQVIYRYPFSHKNVLEINCPCLSGLFFYKITNRQDAGYYSGKVIFN